MNALKSLGGWAIIVIALLVLMAGSGVWSWYNPKVVERKVPVEVEKIRTVEKIRRVEIPVEVVKVIEKEKLVEKFTVPEWVKSDDNQQVLAAGRVPPWRGETEVTAGINTETGEGWLLQRQVRPSFLEFTNIRRIGIRGGIGLDGYTGDLWGSWDFLRVAGFHLGVYAEGSGSSEGARGKLMVQGYWEF